DATVIDLTLVSSDGAGAQANNVSFQPAISADGRFIAFSSDADNLVAGDTNGATDVFVKDLHTGNITRVSTDAAGNEADSPSAMAAISADGRYVVFGSVADNLVPEATPGLFVKDTQTGAITLVNDSFNGLALSISADGQRVLFGV